MSTNSHLPWMTPAWALGIRGLAVLVLVGVTYVLCRSTPAIVAGGEAGLTMELPIAVGNFTGENQEVSEAERIILPKDTEFAKMLYRDADGDSLNCQIVLSGGEKRSIHRPEICLPAQGWTKKSGEVIAVPLDDGTTIEVTKLVISRPLEVRPGTTKELTSIFTYFFVGKNMTTPDHWRRILHTDMDRVLHNVNHRWAYVIFSAPVLEGFKKDGMNQQQTLDMLKKFIGEVAPQILKRDQPLKSS